MPAKRYAAFLRAINVGGRRVTNEELASHVAGAGVEDVATYQAAGNVVFTGSGRASALERRIEAQLADALSYEVGTMVRTMAELAAIAEAMPFAPADGATMHVMILKEAPTAAARKAVLAMAADGDELHLADRELYWYRHGKLMDAAVDMADLGRAVGVVNTMRTVGTLQRMVAKFGG